ncbi:MAG: hypothetical protein AAFR44_03385 [Pseudomonadota bacterium]
MQQFIEDIQGQGDSAKPYLFFVTGSMCFMCMQLEPMWEQAATELKAASYGVGRILGDVDQVRNSVVIFRLYVWALCVER